MTKTPLEKKSSVNTMRGRFDKDVERFSDLEIAQQAVVDAPVMLELISKLAVAVKPDMENLLDIGCGGGNNAIAIIREGAGN